MAERPTLILNEVSRRMQSGNTEALPLTTGVNLIVGEPNTGKTKWLETIDYMLGDTGSDPFSIAPEGDPLAEKYDAAGLRFTISGETYSAERRWREPGAKSKIFVDDEAFSPKEFQHFLMAKLDLPILAVPSGNPFSGQTWPELSFRELLRHLYRQQRFWSQLVDKQPETTFDSCIQYFLGLAEYLYTDEYAARVRLTNELHRLRSRRDQFAETLTDIARDFLDEDSLTLSVTETSLETAAAALNKEYEDALQERERVLEGAFEADEVGDERAEIVTLTSKRAALIEELEASRESFVKLQDRLDELQNYEAALQDEAKRLRRADSAATILADLKVTHCPACNQTVSGRNENADDCFLCHQPLKAASLPEELAKQRVDYERARLNAELTEATELVTKAEAQANSAKKRIARLETDIDEVERSLAPVRHRLSALVDTALGAVDKRLGALSERAKQVKRLTTIFNDKQTIEDRITELEDELRPIVERSKELAGGLDFSMHASWLEDGMNDYLTAIRALEPKAWPHRAVGLYLSASTVTFRVGDRRWDISLGGTASLYYLMAYHYGLFSLRERPEARVPGFSMIDFPAEFAGTKIGDGDDFVVQPFIDLLNRDSFDDCQLIVTGASFDSLKDVHRIELTEPYVT